MTRFPRSVAAATVAAVVFATVLLVWVSMAGPALAHSVVRELVPSEDSQATDVTEVRVVFNEDVRPEVATVVVTGSDGSRYESGEATVEGDSVIQPVGASLPGGTTTVAYRVISADGHPVTGQYEFSHVRSAESNGPSEAAERQAPEAQDVPAATDAASSPPEESSSPSMAPILISLATIPLMVLVLFLLIRYGLHRHTSADSGTEPPTAEPPTAPSPRVSDD